MMMDWREKNCNKHIKLKSNLVMRKNQWQLQISVWKLKQNGNRNSVRPFRVQDY